MYIRLHFDSNFDNQKYFSISKNRIDCHNKKVIRDRLFILLYNFLKEFVIYRISNFEFQLERF